MMLKRTFTGIAGGLALLCLLTLAAGPVNALTVDVTAGSTTQTMPDGTTVPAWGYALQLPHGDGLFHVPGQAIRVPAGEGLTVNLTNNLPESTSLHILGQVLSNNGGAVWTAGTSDIMTGSGLTRPTDTTSRVRSFSHETTPGNVGVYEWANLRPGSYILQSATNPAKQVQMGLFAPVIQNALEAGVGAAQAYAGVEYDVDQVVFFHEVDPEIQEAIAGGYYGANPTTTPPPGKTVITSSVLREPKYFLINGMGWPNVGLNPLFSSPPGQSVLLRFFNSGLETHVPQLLGTYFSSVAEDGNPHNAAKAQTAFELPPSKTIDALVLGGGNTYSLYDARLHLTNAGATPGGMLAKVAVGTDTVTIISASYNPATRVLAILASTDSLPVGTAALSASVTDGTVNIGPSAMTHIRDNIYRKQWFGVASFNTATGSVTVNSNAGGSDTQSIPYPPPPPADTVTIISASYNPATRVLAILASTDSLPVGTAALSASVTDGTVNIGPSAMTHIRDNIYRKQWFGVASFNTATGSVTVNSNGGGTATISFP